LAAKKDYSASGGYGGYNYFGSGSHKTVSYTKFEDKSPTRTDSSAFSKYSTSSTPLSSSRFLKREQTSTEKLDGAVNTEGRYTYRTRPQPVLKKLDIPPLSSNSKPETPAAISPTSPTAAKTFSPEKQTTPVKSTTPDYPLVTSYVNVTTRGTSPNPPSTYSRSRRSDIAREIIKDIPKPPKVESKDKETQTEKVDDTSSRFSRFSRTSTPWTSSLLDKYSSGSSSYASPVSRYMSKVNTDLPKSVSRYSRNESDSSSKSSPIDKIKESVSSVVASIKKTPLPQTVSYRRETSPLRKPVRERSVCSPSPVRRLSVTKKSTSPEKSVVPKTSPSPLPSRKNSLKSESPEVVETKAPSPRRSPPKRISPEKISSSKPLTRASKSPEKAGLSPRKSLSPEKSAPRKSASPEKAVSQTVTSVTAKRKSVSSEKLTVSRQSPEKVFSRRSSLSRSPEKTTPVKPVTEKAPISKSPEKRLKSTSPEKKRLGVLRNDSKTSIKSNKSKTPESDEHSPSVSPKLSKMSSKLNLSRNLSKGSNLSSSGGDLITKTSSCKDLSESSESSLPAVLNKGQKLEKKKSLIFKEIMQNERETSPEIPTFENADSNIVIENLKTVLEDLKSDLLREHVIESPSKSANNSCSSLATSSHDLKIGIELNNNDALPVKIEIHDDNSNFMDEISDGHQKLIPLSVDLPSPLELSPPTNKKPPLSPSKTDGKLFEGKAKKSILGQKHLKASSSLNALVKPKNKDFRKSPLNMNSSPQLYSKENNNASNEDLLQKSKSGDPKCGSSNSISSLPENKLMKTKVIKALNTSEQSLFDDSLSLSLSSKLDQAGASANDLSVGSLSPQILSDNHIDQIAPNLSRPASTTQFIRHSKSSRNDDSSTESTSGETESEESEESEEEHPPLSNGISKMLCSQDPSPVDSPILPVRSKSRSRSRVISRTASGTSEDPSGSLPLDKPPLPPPTKSKEESPNKAASYLMRALAPVTNLFFSKNKEDKSNTSECDRMDTSQSISELPLDKSDDQLDSESNALFSEESTEASPVRDERYRTLPVRKRPESQDIDWWLDENERQAKKNMLENANMPTILAESESSSKLEVAVEPVVASVTEKSAELESAEAEPEAKKKLQPVSSGEKPWWAGSSENVQEPPHSPLSDPPGDNVIRKVFKSSSGVNTMSWCLDSTEDISESEESESESSEEQSEEEPQPGDIVVGTKRIAIKRIESGEKAWWMQSNAEIPQGIAKIASKTSLTSEKQLQHKLHKQASGDKIRMIMSNADIPEGVRRAGSKASMTDEQCAQVYRIRTQQSGDQARWLQSTENVPVALKISGSSNSLSRNDSDRKTGHRKYKIRHIDSGDQAWWLPSDDNIPGGIKRTSSKASDRSVQRNESAKSLSNSENHDKKYKIRHIESGEQDWWMQSSDNVPDGIKRNDSRASSKGLRRNESGRSIASSGKRYKIRHIESGEAAWWMQNSDTLNIPDGVKRTESFRSHTGSLKRNESNRSLSRNRLSKAESGDLSGISSEGVKRSESILSRLKNIKRIESGERAWWLDDSEDNVPEGITRLPSDKNLLDQLADDLEEEEEEEESCEEEAEAEEEKKPRWNLLPTDSGERPWWLEKGSNVPEGVQQLTPSESEEEETEEEEYSEAEGGEALADQPLVPKFPLVLGDRTSPDGLEMPTMAGRRFALGGRESPYENIEWLGEKMYIGDSTNIDDILGDIEPLPLPAAEEKTQEKEAAGAAAQIAKGFF